MTDADLDSTERLLAAALDLAAARALAQVMETSRRAARDLTGADGVTFVLREGDLVHYADEEAIGPLWKGCRFPIGACISGWAMLHRQTVAVEDIYADPRIPHDAYRPTFVKSLAMVPIGVEEPVAALGAYWARTHRATARELRHLECLAGFAGLALANEALVRELRDALAAREEFITVAAHELRTPLAALTLTLHGAARARARAPDEEVALLRRSLGRAERHAERLTKLVDVLLDVQRTPDDLRLERAPCELAGLVATTAAELDAGARVVVQVDEPVEGRWDAARVRQIVENLVSNGLKFGSGEPVEVAVSRDGAWARLTVADRGPGIPAEDRDRIFGKYERAVSARNFGGFGLGLWIVRQNVEAHGGTIDVESRPGGGSRFVVLLPCTMDNVAPLRDDPGRARRAQG